MRKRLLGTVLILSAIVPASGRAQTAWDTPMLLPPNAAAGTGVFLTDMHGGGVSVMGMWRPPEWNYGLRGGIGEGAGGSGLAIFGGVDYSGMINTSTQDFPLDVDWVFGAGLGISDGVRVSVPLGLSAGHSFQAEGARFTPYTTPRVVLDGFFGNNREELDMDVALDIGLDLHFTSAGGPFNGNTIRFAASLGDRSGIGLGVIF